MDYGKLVHVLESFQNLEAESFGKSHWEALEVVVSDELVQVDWKHFEKDAHMGPESKLTLDSDNVFCIVSVLWLESVKDFDLNFALLMELLPILKDLDCTLFLGLVVITFEHNTKSSSAQFFLNFISVIDVVFCLI